jgi:hypothetical protein
MIFRELNLTLFFSRFSFVFLLPRVLITTCGKVFSYLSEQMSKTSSISKCENLDKFEPKSLRNMLNPGEEFISINSIKAIFLSL